MTDQTAATRTRKKPAAKPSSQAKSKPEAASKPKVQTESAPQPKVRSAPPSPPIAEAGFMHGLGPLLLSPENREAIERLSMNLARAALTAQGAITEAALRQADK